MAQRTAYGVKPSALVALVMTAAGAANAGAEEPGTRHGGWRYGIGTGVFGLNIDGDVGVGTRLLGPIRINGKLDMHDVKELADSAFGLAGFASKGPWLIQYRGGRLKLSDSTSGTTLAGVPASAELDFKAVTTEIAVGYQFPRMGRHLLGVIGGLAYTSHEYDATFVAGATEADRSIDNDWTDGLLGFTYAFAITDRVSWANELDGRYGGSNGSWHARSAINWRLGGSRPWVLSFYGDFKRLNFEEGSPANANWYLYKAKEFGPGFGFMYTF
jgi:hypothetical protein